MEISKSSWHYKLNSKMQKAFKVDVMLGKTFTTCSYIWLTIASMLLYTFHIIVISMISIFLSAMLLGMVALPVTFLMDLTFESKWVSDILGLGVMGWTAVICALVTLCIIYLVERIGEGNTKREKEKASLMKQAVKDRKEGVCTIVTFK